MAAAAKLFSMKVQQEPVNSSRTALPGMPGHTVETLLEKGFQLAHFIIHDRAAAVQILSDAASKFQAERNRERKRVYWRYKHLKRRITRNIRADSDLFQWLIYFEAEQHERRMEQAGQITAEDFIIRYIKHLLQITTPMSSFYVGVGMLRLLYDYSTAECRSLYEWLADHYPEAEEYRKVKGALINRLQNRFGDFLRIRQRNRGEIRFESCDNPGPYVALVEQCLRAFTPWSTNERCWVPAVWKPTAPRPTQLLEMRFGSDPNATEALRSHAFIHPSCFGRMAQVMGLQPPTQRLSIPSLFSTTHGDGEGRSNSRDLIPDLTQQERQAIAARLQREAQQVRRITPRHLRIMVDHEIWAEFDVMQSGTFQRELSRDAQFIEIWAEDNGEDVLLAAHCIDHVANGDLAPTELEIDVSNARILLLKIMPVATSSTLMVECRPRSAWARLRQAFARSPWWQLSQKYALVTASVFLLTTILITATYWHNMSKQQALIDSIRKELAQERADRVALEKSIPSAEVQSASTYRLSADDEEKTRGFSDEIKQAITLSRNSDLVQLLLLVEGAPHNRYRVALKNSAKTTVVQEDYLKLTSGPDGNIVKFLVPTFLLHKDADYVVKLEALNDVGKPVETSIFTFHVNR